jgi:hypothetical protein
MTTRRNTHIVLVFVDAVIALFLNLMLMNQIILNQGKLLFQAIMMWD